MDEDKNRRRKYFIDKQFQNRFILRFCFLVVLASLISGVLLYLFSKGTVTTAFVNSRLSIVSTANYILPALISSSLVAILLIGITTAIVVVYQSHRIAGPLFNIERSVKRMGEGVLWSRITLRSSDEMVRLADSLNEMAEELKNHLLEIKLKSVELGKIIESLKSSANKDEIEKLSKKKEELDKLIGYFKLEG